MATPKHHPEQMVFPEAPQHSQAFFVVVAGGGTNITVEEHDKTKCTCHCPVHALANVICMLLCYRETGCHEKAPQGDMLHGLRYIICVPHII